MRDFAGQALATRALRFGIKGVPQPVEFSSGVETITIGFAFIFDKDKLVTQKLPKVSEIR